MEFAEIYAEPDSSNTHQVSMHSIRWMSRCLSYAAAAPSLVYLFVLYGLQMAEKCFRYVTLGPVAGDAAKNRHECLPHHKKLRYSIGGMRGAEKLRRISKLVPDVRVGRNIQIYHISYRGTKEVKPHKTTAHSFECKPIGCAAFYAVTTHRHPRCTCLIFRQTNTTTPTPPSLLVSTS